MLIIKELIMALDRLPTRTGNDSAFHAIFGERNEDGEYGCDPAIIIEQRKKIAGIVKTSTTASTIFPSIKEAIEQLIRNKKDSPLEIDKFPRLSKLQDTYVIGQNIDDLLSEGIIKEYATRLEMPDIKILPCELDIVAHACEKTVVFFKNNNQTTPFTRFNRSCLLEKNVYFDGNYYQAMENYKASGFKAPLPGIIYQLKLLMLFLYSGIKNKYEFSLATEMNAAEKFDDLVFKYRNLGDTTYKYRYIQAKHTTKKNQEISSEKLFEEEEGNFSLYKYFFSYQKIKTHPNFKNAHIGELCICTNMGLTPDLLLSTFVELKETDDILQISQTYHTNGVKYKFKNEYFTKHTDEKQKFYNKLKTCPDKSELANALYELFKIVPGETLLKKDQPKVPKSNPLYKKWGMWLENNNIIDKVKKTLTDDFKKGKNLSDEAEEFKKLYDQKGAAKPIPIKDADIDEFLKLLVFAVEQPDEIALGKIITTELGSKFSNTDEEMIYGLFQNTILDWMKEKEGIYYTHERIKSFFASVQQKISRLDLMRLHILYQWKLEAKKIAFKPLLDIQNFLKDSNKIIIYLAQKALPLATAAVYQTLYNLKENQTNSTIFVDIKTALLRKEDFDNAYKLSKLLVLTWNNNVAEEEAKNFVQNLLNSLDKKILFITDNLTILSFLEKISPGNIPYTQLNAANDFATLTEASQENLLQRTIIFQGQDKTLREIVTDLNNIIDAEVLLELVENEKIKVGEEFKFPKPNYYIPRTFKHGICITKEGLQKNNTDFFAISGSSKKDLSLIVVAAAIRNFSEENNEDKTDKILKRYIILDSANPLAQFEELCIANPHNNVHFLKWEINKFNWEKSQGSLSNLSPYVQKENADPLQKENVIISAAPGMGKSTVSSYLAHILQKERDTNIWIIKINLLEVENRLKKIQLKNEQEIIYFFIKSSSSKLAKKIFEKRLNVDGYLTIFLDGFDEIQEKQQIKVIKLLEKLKTKKVKIVITTRPHMQERLEDTLRIFSHELTPFIDTDQKNFLEKFWLKKLKKSDPTFIDTALFYEKTCVYISLLLEKFKKIIKENVENEFIGIPLQAKLLALAFLDSFNNFYKTNIPPEFPIFNLYALYQKFIEKKYQIALEKDKIHSNAYNLWEAIKFIVIERLEEKHQQIANHMLFSPEKSSVSSSSEEQDKSLAADLALIRAAGIIQFTSDKQHFTHRTFAEYFAAKFLVRGLKEPSDRPAYLNSKDILLRHIFRNRNITIRTFIQEQITTKDMTLQEIWKGILKDNLFYTDTVKSPAFSITSRPINFQTSWEQSIYSLRKSMSSYREKSLTWKAYVSQAIKSIESLCQATLNISDIKKLSKSIHLLNDLLDSSSFPELAKKEIKKHQENIYWHYVKTCDFQKEIANMSLCQDSTEIFLLDHCMNKKLKITLELMEPLTKGKIFYYLIKGNFSDLLLAEKQNLAKQIKSFLIEKEEYDLLYFFCSQFPQYELTAREVDTIFLTNKQRFNWLENDGVKIVKIFKIFTNKISQIFNDILPVYPVLIDPKLSFQIPAGQVVPDGWHNTYSFKVWHNFLLPLFHHLNPLMDGVNHLALLSSCVHFMRFSYHYFDGCLLSPCHLDFTFTSIKNILTIIEEQLRPEKITEKTLLLCVTQLYLFSKTRLQIIAIGSSLLILDPITGDEYELHHTYKNLIKDLLLLKPHYGTTEAIFEEQCKQAIETIKSQNSISTSSSKRRNDELTDPDHKKVALSPNPELETEASNADAMN